MKPLKLDELLESLDKRISAIADFQNQLMSRIRQLLIYKV